MKEFFLTGDSPFFSIIQLKNLSWLPSVWHEEYGLGLTDLPRLWLEYPFRLMVKFLSFFGLSWFFIEKILWGSAILVVFFGIYRLLRSLGISKLFSRVGGFLYVCNTYTLLLIGGGQIGVLLGYAAIPWIIYAVKKGYTGTIVDRIYCSIVIGISLMADLRLAVLGVVTGFFLSFVSSWLLHEKGTLRRTLRLFCTIPFIIFPMHAFWIIPLIFYPSVNLGSNAYTGSGIANFLSFADYSHALSFLHPNWPENLFGKTYFLQPEFIILPILAYSSLLFLNRMHPPAPKLQWEGKTNAIIFTLIALIAVFFAKGSNPPFGELYLWCITFIPGFILFRDSTKFYAVIGCAYTYLIASFGLTLSTYLQKRFSRISIGIAWGIVLINIVLVRNIFFKNVIRFTPMSPEYSRLEKTFLDEQRFFRTMWIPTDETFSPMGNMIPGVTPEMVFHESSVSAISRLFGSPNIGKQLAGFGIQYVVVIPDERQSHYLNDYVFDPEIRNSYTEAIQNNPLFEKNTVFSRLQVFRNLTSSVPLLTSDTKTLLYTHPQNGVYYMTTEGTPDQLRFLFQYDPYWQLTDGVKTIFPQKDNEGFMIFFLKGFTNTLTLQYLPEQMSRRIAPWSIIFTIVLSGIAFILMRRKQS